MQTAQSTQYVIPTLGSMYERLKPYAYPILRVAYGAWFIPHGCQKLFGWWGGDIARTAKGFAAAKIEPAMFWVYYIGTLEVLGGILIVLGFLTRPVAALFFGFMAVATFYYNAQFGYFWTNRGLEMPLLLLVLSLVIMIRGGGEYSLDRRIGREI
jgi:putative oxidoreductase